MLGVPSFALEYLIGYASAEGVVMARIEIGKFLAADTRVCGGRLIFRGSRVSVSDVLELVAAGYSAKDVSKQYRGVITPNAITEAVSLTRRGVVREVSPKAKTAA